MTRLDPTSVDLAELAAALRAACGAVVAGAVVGRTRMRDAVGAHLACSQLEAEQLVDTLIGRGFVSRQGEGDRVEWVIGDD
ncbi:MAG TPA: hypothetical protein PLR99_07085 [Polyangiaceae bacterium]|nr:hypothetical protein [Polyangiaceae bacterium]